MLDTIIDALLALLLLYTEGDYTAPLYDFFGWEEDHPTIDKILVLRGHR